MDWIRKNPHLLTLILVGLGVLAASGVVVLNAQHYNEKFDEVKASVVPGAHIEPLDVTVLDNAQKELEHPAEWTSPLDPRPKDPKEKSKIYPFVPPLYSIGPDGKPEKAGTGSHYTDRLTKEPIPDRWFLENRLPLDNPEVATMDPDGDGFLNEDEYRAKTDPNDKNSHPPYYSKLFVKRHIRVPFLLKFQVYDGDPKKPEEMQFQVNPLSLHKSSQFLKLGDMVAGTKFKLLRFQLKMQPNAATGDEVDVSELTLLDTELNTEVVLILNKVTDSPDSLAEFIYFWPKNPLTFQVKKLGQFVLLPEKDKDHLYQLLDINDDQAVIKLPSGETQTIPRAPAGYP